MTTIWIEAGSAGRDEDFEFDIGETVHLQGSARLGVFKIRVADTFLSTDRGTYLYWKDTALGTLNWAQLPTGAYTGVRLAAWISSNFASATYGESTNEITVAHDGNRENENDQELRAQFPGSGSYPAGASPSRPQSINHPSFLEGSSQIFAFVQMNPYNELCLRCGSLANAADTVGPLGHDIIAKIICKQGVGYIMESDTHENHMVKPERPHYFALPPLQAHGLRGQRGEPPRHQHHSAYTSTADGLVGRARGNKCLEESDGRDDPDKGGGCCRAAMLERLRQLLRRLLPRPQRQLPRPSQSPPRPPPSAVADLLVPRTSQSPSPKPLPRPPPLQPRPNALLLLFPPL